MKNTQNIPVPWLKEGMLGKDLYIALQYAIVSFLISQHYHCSIQSQTTLEGLRKDAAHCQLHEENGRVSHGTGAFVVSCENVWFLRRQLMIKAIKHKWNAVKWWIFMEHSEKEKYCIQAPNLPPKLRSGSEGSRGGWTFCEASPCQLQLCSPSTAQPLLALLAWFCNVFLSVRSALAQACP